LDLNDFSHLSLKYFFSIYKNILFLILFLEINKP